MISDRIKRWRLEQDIVDHHKYVRRINNKAREELIRIKIKKEGGE